ncbi:putative Endonuclease-reverse transcriptase [Trypanosoma cruzi]|uniref:Putative Endonuclease-reverse transcriptase n=1 Tax=Trypanosoma cruzi TaxID=5693 RepID=A0A2V2X5B9_TRYCR|nr:putative Endonuclease-reverse transcriptase [Trypanosoma cruzi]
MLTFTLHQAFKDTIPSAPKLFYSWGKCKWDLFIKDLGAQLPAYDYKKQSTGIKAFTRALITSYRRHCPRGMHKDGPRLWDDTLTEAERIATDSKARYLHLPTPDREAEMQRTRSQFFLLLRERLRNTYSLRISKLNPGEPLAWKYISGRKKASLPSPTSILLGGGQHTYKTARRAANALNHIFLPFHPSHKAVRPSKGINRQSTSLNIVSSSFWAAEQQQVYLYIYIRGFVTPLLMHLLILRNCLLRYVIRRMARPPDRMKSTVRHCDIFRQRVFDSLFDALTTAGRPVQSRLSGDALPSFHS